jgi:hypothetical protein
MPDLVGQSGQTLPLRQRSTHIDVLVVGSLPV